MFTGIVGHVGQITRITPGEDVTTFSITGAFDEVAIGDSVAVSGVCLTATSATPGAITVDVVPETLRRTRLGSLDVRDRVNLELSLRADGFVGGHFVQGHVDGVGDVVERTDDADGVRLSVKLPEGLERYVVEKGSVALDGVSLTVAAVAGATFEVALIPHTLESTTLAEVRHGAPINVEVDMIAKHVERLLAGRLPNSPENMESR